MKYLNFIYVYLNHSNVEYNDEKGAKWNEEICSHKTKT